MSALDGVIVIDKPEGPTSARVVAAVRKRLRVKKIGHTGTLDPMATGVLPMCIGRATKIAGLLLADDKSYTGELELGIETDTLDREGQVTARNATAAAAVTTGELARAFAALTGDIEQVPPMFSALRSGGKRLHELARAGQTVERPPRPVRVDRFELTALVPGDGVSNPRARFVVDCSKGTYVRALARDVGIALGCGAHLTALRRTRAGAFTLERAIAPDAIERDTADRHLISILEALHHLRRIDVGEDLVARVLAGLQLRWPQVSESEAPSGRFCIVGPGPRVLAVARVVDGLLAYDRVFPVT